MRTLKKVLALSLVCAMAFTMMAGAAFNDQSKINADLANDIELMTALSVFKGDDKGNLNPEDLLTRAQAAKLIYVLKNNGNDDGAVAFTGVSTYADVPVGFWGEGYINFCTNSGYMGGWMQNGVRMFDPNGQVTGVEMAKMLLCLVGYKADLQGYAGASWAANVTSDALNASIFADYGMGYNAPVARQWAARLLSNAINANVVTYSKGELSISDKTYAEKALKLESVVGTLDQTKSVKLQPTDTASPVRVASASNKSKITIGKATATTKDPAGSPEFSFDASANLLGQQVKVYYKAGTTAGVTNAQKIYSVMANDSRAYNVKADDVKVTAGTGDDSKKTYVAFPGMAKTNQNVADGEIKVYNNYRLLETLTGDVNTEAADKTDDSVIKVANLKAYGLGKNDNSSVKIVTNDKNEITAIYFNDSPYYAVVETIDTAKCKFDVMAGNNATEEVSKKHVLANYGGIVTTSEEDKDYVWTLGTSDTGKKNFAKINFVDTVVKGDVVKITPTFAANELGYKVEKLAPITGKVTSFGVDGTSYNTLTIDGTAYKVGVNNVNAYKFSTADSLKAKDATTFYTDGKYLIYATGEKKSETFTKNIAYVIGARQGSTNFGDATTAKVQLLFADNTIKTLNYTKSDDQPSAAIDLWKKEVVKPVDEAEVVKTNYATQIVENCVYEYIMAEDGTVSLKALKSSDKNFTAPSTTALAYSKENKLFNVAGTSVRNGADTVVFTKFKDTTDGSKTKYAAVKANELTSFAGAPEVGEQPAGVTTNTATQYAYSTATGVPVMIFGTANYAVNLPSALSDAKFAVLTGDSKIDSIIDKNSYLVTVPAVTNGTETTLKFKIAQSDAEVEMDALNTFKNKLVSYKMKGDYVSFASKTANADLVAVTAVNTVVKDKWSSVAIQGFDASTLYGMNTSAKVDTAVFYTITADTKVMYVDASGSNNKIVTDGKMIAAEEKTVANAVVLAKDPSTTGGTMVASVIVIEVNGGNVNKNAMYTEAAQN